jgi:hypothetical protein
MYYPDADRDGYGRSAGAVSSCTKPSGDYAEVGGDCADDDDRVHPSQTTYFAAAYPTPSGGDSFDYDCSGAETPDPAQMAAAPSCGLLSLVDCGGAGYGPTNRTGNGVNAICGSTSVITCKANTLGLLCGPQTESVDAAHRCR